MNLNICLISREYPPDTAFGGIATFSQDIALMLRENGHQVTVFSQSLSQNYFFEDNGVKVYKIRIPQPFGSYGNLPCFILAFNTLVTKEILKKHRKYPFDLIDTPDHLAEGLLATYLGIPIVTRLHTPFSLIVDLNLNNYKKDLSFSLIKKMERIALRRSTVLYAPCIDLVKRCDALLNIKSIPVKIFGYPINLDVFKPLKEKDYTQAKRILFVGRLEQRKGIETIANAFAQISKIYPDSTLTLVGQDTPNISGFSSARIYLESKFQGSSCLKQVNFQDPVPIKVLPDIFAIHDIVWVPSLYDNYPLVCLEAMACGKALIVSDAGGLPEIIDHGTTGFIFKAGDFSALVKWTSILLDNPFLIQSFGLNARQFVQSSCSLISIYESTLDLYSTALSIFRKKQEGKR